MVLDYDHNIIQRDGRQAVLPVSRGAVVPYGKERKQETRRRIIQTAGRRFKRDGIDGSGIATHP
jgi:AcrR family transcriptional regulator